MDSSGIRGPLPHARRAVVRGLAHEPVHHELRHPRQLPAEAGPRRAGGHPVRRMVLRVAVRPPVASRDRVVHRPRGWCTLGRETSIQKVEWAEDGWPYIVGGHGGERYVEAPKDAIETVAPASRDQHDEFDADVLGLDWNTLRVPFDEKMGSVGGGSLKLIGQARCATRSTCRWWPAAGRRSISTPRPAWRSIRRPTRRWPV